MHELLRQATLLKTLEIGQSRGHGGLAMFPLLGGRAGEADYDTLDDALARGTLRVREVSRQGSVPELKADNRGERPVLVLDGEELVGAKQNRVVNLTVLVPALITVKVPVSCVEMGRWSYRTPECAAAPWAHYAAGRARRVSQVSNALRARGARSSDQADVWADIYAKAARLATHSSTDAMGEIFEGHEGSLEEYVQALPPVAGQCGAVFAIGSRIVGVDCFEFQETAVKLFPKLVRSYALDAIDPATAARGAEPVNASDVRGFLDEVGEADESRFPAVGAGDDIRLAGLGVAGGALALADRVIHLCAFRCRPVRSSPARKATDLAAPYVRRRHYIGRSGPRRGSAYERRCDD